MKFPDLAYGARFKYVLTNRTIGGENASCKTFIKLNDEGCGLIAEYDPNYILTPRWLGQGIYSFCDDKEEMLELDIIALG